MSVAVSKHLPIFLMPDLVWNSAQGVPKSDPIPSSFLIPDSTQFNFENHWVAGNRKCQVLPDILEFQVLPNVSGIPRPDARALARRLLKLIIITHSVSQSLTNIGIELLG